MNRITEPVEIKLQDKDKDEYTVSASACVIRVTRKAVGMKQEIYFYARDAETLCSAIMEAANAAR